MKKILGLILIVAVFSSCSRKVAFTSNIQNEYKFSEDNLKKIQFYTSDEIVLVRTKKEGNVTVEQGTLLIKNEDNVEKIIIKKNTPCVLEKVIDNNKFLYSFEYGANRVLLFGNDSNGYYSLMAKEWKNKVGEVKYTDKSYLTVNGNVYLLIKVKNLRKLKGRQRTVKGVKVK